MKKLSLLNILTFVAILFSTLETEACTTFCIKNGERIVFGRNFDFPVGHGHVLINKKNVRKVAMVRPPEKALEWTSRYGSVSFNQQGREFPYGGINEKGLVLEQMALNESIYPEIDERSGLTELQWIQYHLDNSANVQEVIASKDFLRISPQSVAKLHFLVADKMGNVATIEYIEGKMVVHQGESLKVAVLANDTYERSTEYLQNFSGFGGNDPIPFSTAPLDRFVNAANGLQEYSGENLIEYSFEILDRVRQEDSTTQWSIVYDLTNLEIYFQTQRNPEIRKLSLENFSFDCASGSQYVNIHESPIQGKIQFRPFSYEENEALINRVWDEVEFLAPIPVEVRKVYADYPLSLVCEERKI
ncbi:linear amide C-N hydrolase [Salinimicrobium sp. HB62]|uniref:linear amide C-N hydrolase n=1 Tax=Salinimicrobium sp. HB62 TaxID=3077781 RepID=UPI002D773E4A|nr:linear amide C-N hydrolase [Salinimicrobium sp. HB62]